METSQRKREPLNVFLVGADEYQVGVFKNAVGLAGISTVRAFEGAKKALAIMHQNGAPDILFVWFGEENRDALGLCRVVRNPETFAAPFLPIVAVMETATLPAVRSVRDVGVDEFLACPFSPKALAERVQAITQDRRGFVHVPGYFGPDRRRGAMARYLGSDRRSTPSQLIDPLTEQRYTA